MIDAAARRRHLRHAVAPARWRHGRAAAPGTVCRARYRRLPIVPRVAV